MNRRDFLKKAGAAAAGATLSPLMFANAQAGRYNWAMVTSWPTSLDTLQGGAEDVARILNEITGGDVQVQVYPAGAQVGAFEVYDAVSSGAFEMAHAAPYYFINKNPAHAFFTAVPFGMTVSQYEGWLLAGDGQSLHDELTHPDGVQAFLSGNTGPQTSGWFNREINVPADLRGLTIRFPGFGGQVLTELGANVQNLPGGEIYLALETGVIDAADWVAPYDDRILGLHQVAQYYYMPSWAEPSAGLASYINLDLYESLDPDIQSAVRTASAEAGQRIVARYMARNGEALRQMVEGGTQVRSMTPEVLNAMREATERIHEQNSAGNELYARILESYRSFQSNSSNWLESSEHSYLNYLYESDNG